MASVKSFLTFGFLSLHSLSLRFSALAFRPLLFARQYNITPLLRMSAISNKLHSPSAERNKTPIWQVLGEKIFLKKNSNESLRVLEVAAGAGVHSYHFTSELSKMGMFENIQWYATDPEDSSRLSILAYREDATNASLKSILQPPLALTLGPNGVLEEDVMNLIPKSSIDVVVCINMIHISPWDATVGLMKMAQTLLKKDGYLYCYGPYKENGAAVESNL